MNNYFVYHNEDKIGKSVKEIGLLAAYTNNDVEGSEGGVAWVISAVGKRNKKYKVSMCFEISKAHSGYSPVEAFKNSVAGEVGVILEEPIDVTNEAWLKELRDSTANFVRGFSQLTNKTIVESFERIFADCGFRS